MVHGKFKFDTVGQGLFYWGILNVNGRQFSFLYDCGSTSETRISERVENFKEILRCCQELDMLVISHFDEDHMNGIRELLIDTKVESVFIPYYHLDDYLLLVCFIYGYGIAANIGNIILVPPTDTIENNIEGDIENLDNDDSGLRRANDIPNNFEIDNINIFKANKIKFRFKKIWEFKFYNVELKPNNNDNNSIIEDKIKEEINGSSLEEFIKKPDSKNL